MGVMPTDLATRRIVTASAPSRWTSFAAATAIRSAVDLWFMYTVYTPPPASPQENTERDRACTRHRPDRTHFPSRVCRAKTRRTLSQMIGPSGPAADASIAHSSARAGTDRTAGQILIRGAYIVTMDADVGDIPSGDVHIVGKTIA